MLGRRAAKLAAIEASVGISEAGERAVSDAPHRAQNRLSPGLSAEQRLHFTMDGFTLPLCPRAKAGGGVPSEEAAEAHDPARRPSLASRGLVGSQHLIDSCRRRSLTAFIHLLS